MFRRVICAGALAARLAKFSSAVRADISLASAVMAAPGAFVGPQKKGVRTGGGVEIFIRKKRFRKRAILYRLINLIDYHYYGK